MTATLSTNIAGTIRPFIVKNNLWPYGKSIIPMEDLDKRVVGGTDKMLFRHYAGLAYLNKR